jgi:hypothetical protein
VLAIAHGFGGVGRTELYGTKYKESNFAGRCGQVRAGSQVIDA